MKLRIDSIEELTEFLNLISKYQPSLKKEASEIFQFVGEPLSEGFLINRIKENVNTETEENITTETEVDDFSINQPFPPPANGSFISQPDETEVDIDGVEWDPAVHSMGKTKTKEGRWRVKKGLQPVDDAKTDSFAAEVKKKYISKLEDGDMSLEEMMNIFDENGLLSIDDIEKQPQDILELLDKALGGM